MSEPKETNGKGVTQPDTQPGDESERGYWQENPSAGAVNNVDASRQRTQSTTSTATRSTTTEATSQPTVEVVTPSKATKRANLSRRAELMAKHKLTEHRDANGKRYFVCRGGEYTQEVLTEIVRLEK